MVGANPMKEIITYSLRAGEKISDQYYKDIAIFTGQVLAEADQRAYSIVEDFQGYIQQSGREPLRSRAEYIFEYLTLGVLWNTYTGNAVDSNGWPQRLLTSLAELRKRNEYLKPGVDFIRGILATLFLFRQGNGAHETSPLKLENLDQLLSWLAATGDFIEEVKRLQTWREFLAAQKHDDVARTLGKATALADWFKTQSLEALGCYTPNVEEFLVKTHPAYRWREDVIFCGRQRIEYHLNMVGTEVMNRAFRDQFLETERKIVFVPPCMRAKPEGECKAQPSPFGEHCAACTLGCRVHQVTKLGEKHGFDVFIIPDEISVVSDKKMKTPNDDKLGLVGISCPLTNMTGGWETRRLGIPAQGVILDYCGCPWHWHKDGIPTDINFNQLLQVIGIKNKQSCETVPQDCKVRYSLPV
jgi:hypothetical protein